MNKPISRRKARAAYPVKVASLTDAVGASRRQLGVMCRLCRSDNMPVAVTIGVRHLAEQMAAEHAAIHDLPWPPEDHPGVGPSAAITKG